MPKAGVAVAGYKLDFYWERERFAVEVDGFAFHSSPRAFERDRSRDSDLMSLGVRVMRVTWQQIVNEPEALVARFARALMSD